MPPIKTFKIFISHAFKADADYSRFIELLESYFTYPYAVVSAPEDLKFKKLDKGGRERELRGQIRSANCFIALDSLYMDGNEWARYELEFAVSIGTPVLALRRWKSKEISVLLSNVAGAELGWNPDNIAMAILERSAPARTISR